MTFSQLKFYSVTKVIIDERRQTRVQTAPNKQETFGFSSIVTGISVCNNYQRFAYDLALAALPQLVRSPTLDLEISECRCLNSLGNDRFSEQKKIQCQRISAYCVLFDPAYHISQENRNVPSPPLCSLLQIDVT